MFDPYINSMLIQRCENAKLCIRTENIKSVGASPECTIMALGNRPSPTINGIGGLVRHTTGVI